MNFTPLPETVPTDLRDVEPEPYVAREFPPEGLIPHRMKELEAISVLGALREGLVSWTIKPNN